MNALEIIDEVRRHEAELVLEGQHLVLQGRGAKLPEALEEEIREHRAEVMVALGAPLDGTVGAVLAELRPNLPDALREVSDSSLLALVNWTIIAAWEKTVRNAHLRHREEAGR